MDADLEDVCLPHNNTMIIHVVLNRAANVHQLLVDGGSSYHILFSHILAQLDISYSELSPTPNTPNKVYLEKGQSLRKNLHCSAHEYQGSGDLVHGR